jgi:glucose/mannose-6-phosphate isomerase
MVPVARRWKTQINENAKAWAFAEPLPEVHHNSVAGYENPYELAGNVVLAMLRSRFNHERNRARYEVTEKVMKRTGLVYHMIDAEGDTPLQQMLWMLYLGDYVSFYMAAAYETDPSPVDVIDFLKAELVRAR